MTKIIIDDPAGLPSTATGIRSGQLIDIIKNGNTYKCNVKTISIEIEKNQIDIIGDISIYDSIGKLLNTIFNKKFVVKDIPRKVEVEILENGDINMESIVEITPANLAVTNWDTVLGQQIIDQGAIPFYRLKVIND